MLIELFLCKKQINISKCICQTLILANMNTICDIVVTLIVEETQKGEFHFCQEETEK